MTEEELEALHQQWLECQRLMWLEDIDFDDYWAAVERSREIDRLVRESEQAGESRAND